MAECCDGFKGLKAIQELTPDRWIGIPEVNLRTLVIIFATAYNECAIKSFEMKAIEYLLKPFS